MLGRIQSRSAFTHRTVPATQAFQSKRRSIFRGEGRSLGFFDLPQQVLRPADRTLRDNFAGFVRDREPVEHHILDAVAVQNETP